MEPIPKPLTKGKAKRQRTQRKEKFTDERDDSDESESDDDGDEDKHQDNDEGGESDNEEESGEESDDKESAGEFPHFAALRRDRQLCIARKLQPEFAAPDHDAQLILQRQEPADAENPLETGVPCVLAEIPVRPGGDRGAVSEEVPQGIRSHRDNFHRRRATCALVRSHSRGQDSGESGNGYRCENQGIRVSEKAC